jgi:signal transduction histidine kinase
MGYTIEQWLSLNFLSLAHEQDLDKLATAFDANESTDIVCRLKRANGNYAWIRNIITLEKRLGQVPIARGVFFDITTSIEAADENKSLQAQLQQSNKLEAIRQLAAGVAHEINTPVQYIGDNISFLTDSCQELFSYVDQCQQLINKAEHQQFEPQLVEQILASADSISLDYLRDELPSALTEAKDGTKRVADIVKAMKEFSHPGFQDAQRIDLSRAINNSITMAKNEWKHHAKVEFTADETVPMVECYAGELNQVLLNIIVNAAHAIQEKWPSGEQGLISINTRLEDNQVAITIADNGTGMSDAVKQRIFDPFYTTKDVGKGTGQGMSIAYGIIVEQHGGAINIDSTEGEGTTITLNLPLSCSLADAP